MDIVDSNTPGSSRHPAAAIFRKRPRTKKRTIATRAYEFPFLPGGDLSASVAVSLDSFDFPELPDSPDAWAEASDIKVPNLDTLQSSGRLMRDELPPQPDEALTIVPRAAHATLEDALPPHPDEALTVVPRAVLDTLEHELPPHPDEALTIVPRAVHDTLENELPPRPDEALTIVPRAARVTDEYEAQVSRRKVTGPVAPPPPTATEGAPAGGATHTGATAQIDTSSHRHLAADSVASAEVGAAMHELGAAETTDSIDEFVDESLEPELSFSLDEPMEPTTPEQPLLLGYEGFVPEITTETEALAIPEAADVAGNGAVEISAEDALFEEVTPTLAVEVPRSANTAVTAPPKPAGPPPTPDAARISAETPSYRRKEWFEKAFSIAAMSRLYDYDKATTRAMGSHYLGVLGLQAPANLLDIGCGLGELGAHYARQGYNVVGVDLNVDLLRHAYDSVASENLPLQLAHGDMRELEFDSVFQAVLCTGTTFGYFDDYANFQVLQDLNRALKPRGRLLLGIVNRDYVTGHLPHRSFWQKRECTILEEISFDYATSRMVNQRAIIFPNGSQKEDEIIIRLYSLHELLLLLENTGFEVCGIYGDHLEKSFVGKNNRELLIVAQK